MSNDKLPLRRSCGATAMYFRELEVNEDFRNNQRDIEMFTARTRQLGGAASKAQTVTIKVAVHIVYNSEEQNISDDQVKSQIAVLNEDYRKRNADVSNVPGVWTALVGDANIQFALLDDASLAITRTKTDKVSFGMNESVKFTAKGGHDVYMPENVLNVWVCNLDGLLGYAQFPGGKPQTDGVVINYQAFGKGGSATYPYDLGRTLTHEVGHFLNLHHIWGDKLDCTGDDLVADTPKALEPNYDKPAFPHISCANGPNGDMFVNYMDYVDDDTMVMFTDGQVERMAATLLGSRHGLAE